MANKKILVASLVGAKHTITEADLVINPKLAEQVKVGDEVQLGHDPELLTRISDLEKEVTDKTKELEDLKNQAEALNDELINERKLIDESNKSFKELLEQYKEADEKIKSLSLGIGAPTDAGSVKSKVKVNHGVVLHGKTYSKEQIEKDPSIQEVLLELKSSAVTAIEG